MTRLLCVALILAGCTASSPNSGPDSAIVIGKRKTENPPRWEIEIEWREGGAFYSRTIPVKREKWDKLKIGDKVSDK